MKKEMTLNEHMANARAAINPVKKAAASKENGKLGGRPIVYQYCYKAECCQNFAMSSLDKKPSAEEIKKRSTEEYTEDAITWRYELLEDRDGKMRLDNDYVYCEESAKEIKEKIKRLKNSQNAHDRKLAKELEFAMEML